MLRSGKGDENLIKDIDLSILGSESADYMRYSHAIRKEYVFVSDEDYRKGRGEVLRRFLSRNIYATKFCSHLERQARVNIAAELIWIST